MRVLRTRLTTIAPRMNTAPPSAGGYGSGRGGRPWRRKRTQILERDLYQCQQCRRRGVVTMADEVDHIIPISQGGDDLDGNLESICGPCHKVKSAQEAGAGRRGQGGV